MNAIFSRRSIRNYSGEKVEEAKVEKLLHAAMQAPSARNQRPWEFLVIRNQEIKEKLSEISPYAASIRTADVAIVMMANSSRLASLNRWEQDLAAATQNVLLQATDLGLGSVWLGVAPDAERMNNIKELFELPKTMLPFAVVAIGYPEKSIECFAERIFDESRVKYY